MCYFPPLSSRPLGYFPPLPLPLPLPPASWLFPLSRKWEKLAQLTLPMKMHIILTNGLLSLSLSLRQMLLNAPRPEKKRERESTIGRNFSPISWPPFFPPLPSTSPRVMNYTVFFLILRLPPSSLSLSPLGTIRAISGPS